MNLRLSVAAALAIFTVAGGASAQQTWVGDRRYGEGIGIRTGNFEFHPSLSAEFGYDSNFYQRAENENGGVADVWRLRITPSLSLSTLSERRKASAAVGAPPAFTFNANGLAMSLVDLTVPGARRADVVDSSSPETCEIRPRLSSRHGPICKTVRLVLGTTPPGQFTFETCMLPVIVPEAAPVELIGRAR